MEATPSRLGSSRDRISCPFIGIQIIGLSPFLKIHLKQLWCIDLGEIGGNMPLHFNAYN